MTAVISELSTSTLTVASESASTSTKAGTTNAYDSKSTTLVSKGVGFGADYENSNNKDKNSDIMILHPPKSSYSWIP